MATVTEEAALGEDAAVPAPVVEQEQEPETGSKHKLERKWTFWFDNESKPKQGAAWGTSLRRVYTFDTVEEFWWCVRFFPSGSSLFASISHFFQLGLQWNSSF